MSQLIGILESLNQTVAQLLVRGVKMMAHQPVPQATNRPDEWLNIEMRFSWLQPLAPCVLNYANCPSASNAAITSLRRDLLPLRGCLQLRRLRFHQTDNMVNH